MEARLTAPDVPKPHVHVFPSGKELSVGLADLVVRMSAATAPHPFVVALSGGSLPALLWSGLKAHTKDIDWARWHVVFADERCVAHDDPESNYRACADVCAAAGKVLAIDPKLIKDPKAAAEAYDRELRAILDQSKAKGGSGRIDLALLGMGPDGHCCSLFPGHPLLKVVEEGVLIRSIVDSPKPPPQRITFTLPVVWDACRVVYVCTGEGKKAVVKEVLEKGPSSHFPAALARPTRADAELHWLLDQPAMASTDVPTVSKVASKVIVD